MLNTNHSHLGPPSISPNLCQEMRGQAPVTGVDHRVGTWDSGQAGARPTVPARGTTPGATGIQAALTFREKPGDEAKPSRELLLQSAPEACAHHTQPSSRDNQQAEPLRKVLAAESDGV